MLPVLLFIAFCLYSSARSALKSPLTETHDTTALTVHVSSISIRDNSLFALRYIFSFLYITMRFPPPIYTTSAERSDFSKSSKENSLPIHSPPLINEIPSFLAFSINLSYIFESKAEPPDISRILFVR